MRDRGAVAFFLDMGTGKSLTTVAITGRLFLDGHIRKVLIIAPSSVCAVWPAEYKRFADFPHRVTMLLGSREKRLEALKRVKLIHDDSSSLCVAVINYESTWRLSKELMAYGADLIVCDESQRIKSPTAQQSKAVHRLGDMARYRMILTGTPIQNDTRDLWSQYRFLAPEVFGKSYYAFVNRYAVLGGYGNHQYLGPRNLDELTRKAHAIAYRVTKAECLDLPEKTFEDRAVELEDEAWTLYRRVQKESYAVLDGGQEITAGIVLTKLLRLQQITGGFLTDDDGQTQCVSTAKLDATEDIVRSLCVDEGKKLVIFARFRAELDALMERIGRVLKKEQRAVCIMGDVSTKKRGEIVAQFQEDPATRVFAGQIDACAEGITLTAADTVLYYSVNWNLAKYMQSQDRIHRISQQNRCTYLHLVVPGTIDHKIQDALHKKENLAKTVVDNWRTLLGEVTQNDT